MRLFVYTTCGLLLTLVCLTVSFNFIVDPYRIFHGVSATEYFEPNMRFWKTSIVRSSFREFNGYIFGNSRAAQLPAKSIGSSDIRFFNYATSSECLNETCLKLQYIYMLGGPLREIVLFVSLDSMTPKNFVQQQDLLRMEHPCISGGTIFGLWCRYLLTSEGINGSLNATESRSAKRRLMRFDRDGTVAYGWHISPQQFRDTVIRSLFHFSIDAAANELEWHRKIAEIARFHNTKICLVIAPMPALIWEQYMNDPAVKHYLAAIGRIYGRPAIFCETQELYAEDQYWNDVAHPTQEALDKFLSPKVRSAFGR